MCVHERGVCVLVSRDRDRENEDMIVYVYMCSISATILGKGRSTLLASG